MCAAKLAQHDDDFRQSQSLSDRGQIVPEQSSPLSSNSSASTRNPKFIAGFFCSSSSFSSSSLRGPNLLSWFVVFAVAVETLHYRLDWRAFRRRRFLRLAAPPPASRRALHRAARTRPRQPSSGDGELRAAVFDRLRRALAILRERRRPGKCGVMGAARRRFGLADS